MNSATERDMIIADLARYREHKDRRLQQAAAEGWSLLIAEQILSQAQDTLDRLLGKECCASAQEKLCRVQVFIHEARLIIEEE